MSTNYIAPIWRMPTNANNTPVDKLSNYSMDFQLGGSSGRHIDCGTDLFTGSTIPSISISTWIKTSASGVIMSKDIGTSLNRNFLFQIAGNQLYWQTSVDGTNFDSLIVSQATFDVIDSEWHHIVVTYNTGSSSGDGEKKIYIDGSEIADSPLATYAEIYNTLTVPINIGRRGDNARYFYDNMSQVCIFDYALSSSQVSYLYGLDNPMAITGGEPVAYWPLGDNSNPNAPGSFPNISVGADSVFDFIPNDYINLGTSLQDLLSSNQNTISLWFRSDTASDFDTLFSQGKDSSVGYRLFLSGGDLSLNRSEQNPTNDRQTITISPGPSSQTWNHLVLVTDTSATTKLIAYLNGDPVGSYATGTITYSNGGDVAWIGGQFGITQFWDGQISNLQIWNTDLSSSEATTLYNNGQPLMTGTQPQEANLQAWYKLNQSAIWDNTDWSIDNAESPANWQGCYDRNNSPVAILRDNSSGTSYHNQVFSISVWVKPVSGLATSGVIFSCQNSSNQGVSLVYSNNTLIFKLGDKNTTNIGGLTPGGNWANTNNRVSGVSPTYTPYDQWSHIVVVWNGTDSKFYINGDLVSTITPPSALTIDYSFGSNGVSAIGGRNDSTASGGIFTGKISNFAYWSSEIDQPAVTALYNNGTPEVSISQSPDHWITLEDFANGRVDQIGSLNYNDTATTAVPKFTGNFVSVTSGTSEDMNSTNLVQSNLTRTQPYSNYSFNFDAATNDYITISNPGSTFAYGESALTFSGWINVDNFKNQDGIFGRRYSTDLRATIKLSITSPYNGIMFLTQDGSGTLAWKDWPGILTAGQWYHICITYEAGAVKLYLDGVDQGPTGGTGTIANPMPNLNSFNYPLDIALDRQNTSRLLNGRTSNFCVFDRVLTEDEILKIYNNGVTQNLQATSSFSNNILAWWPMDENSSYYDGTNWVVRELEGGKDGNGVNTGNVEDMVGSAPGSQASGVGSNFQISYLEGNMYNSDKNAYSINMGDYADGVTNPANSGRSTDTP